MQIQNKHWYKNIFPALKQLKQNKFTYPKYIYMMCVNRMKEKEPKPQGINYLYWS